ncbi:hypothetical protein YS110_11105 [Acidovorax sp. YS12]|nr:hypothetical protein [Comamonadaceae bacterium]UJB65257.1 hypothetical protein YS110_11105 [Acidovorax sp. YS12]
MSTFDISRRRFILSGGGTVLGLSSFPVFSATPGDKGEFRSRLYTPTSIVKIKDKYFIVDCWQHRVIWSKELGKRIEEWQALDEDIAGPHSIVSDGEFYVVEDTGRHAIKVFKENNDGFEMVQAIPNVGKRPHRTVYDDQGDRFFVVGSTDQSLHVLKKQGGSLVLSSSMPLQEMQGEYCKSLTLTNNTLYVTGKTKIAAYELGRNGVFFSGVVHLHEKCREMNDLFFLDGKKGFATSWWGRVSFFEDVKELEAGGIDVSPNLGGVPYYFSRFDGKLWLTEINQCSRICGYESFGHKGELVGGSVLFDFCGVDESSIERKRSFPV